MGAILSYEQSERPSYKGNFWSQNANFEQYTKPGKGTGESKTTEEKRIIKPEQFTTLPDIVLLTPFEFLRVEKAPYYKNKAFM